MAVDGFSMAPGRFRHHCVADLAWAVSSPPVLCYPDSDCVWFNDGWYRELYRQIEPRLLQLDNDPQELESLLAAQKDQRLGNYFETLWAFALELSPRFQLIERNLQIFDGDRTLGELDFIVLDKESGRHAHWELAIKFYLGVGNTVNQSAWHGPGKKDRLDLKVKHLRQRQTLLSAHPLVQAMLRERGIIIEDCAVLLKGRLFYPSKSYSPGNFPRAANPSHLAGQWLTRQQLHHFGAGSRFRPLLRSGWMSEYSTADDKAAFSIDELINCVNNGLYRFPLHVVRLEGENEKERLFIVDDNWPLF